jgi:predicted metal-dependent hydrolase
MRITISAHSGVVVTMPARLPRYINPEEFLREKQSWVLKHLEKINVQTPSSAPLEDGAQLFLRGREYRLRTLHNGTQRPAFEIGREEVRVHLPNDFHGDLREVVRGLIRDRATEVITDEAEQLAAQIGVSYKRITVRDQRTKWGSCSKRGNLSFNWRLLLFPPNVLRYVVIHELCHIKHFNHSPQFWALVEQHDPSFRKAVQWLKEHGATVEGALR